MNTLNLTSYKEDLEKAGRILRKGGLVGIPTETVYGLAANAFNGEAVARIFKAKCRPMDNPLIVHIADISEWKPLVSKITPEAMKLAEKFWPGPLTIILPKSDLIPDEVSAGLETVAVRMPSHPVARDIIKAAGVPLAAPSANLSGKPSPTAAAHVLHDMEGRIEAVVDGGECGVGVESTVVSLAGDVPCLLRPGGVTLEQLRETLGEVNVNHAVYDQLKEGETAPSPGMKYKHYAPTAKVIVLRGESAEYIKFVNSHADETVAAICYDEEIPLLNVKTISCGKMGDNDSQAHYLFDALRKVDDIGAKIAYAHYPSTDGVGLAVYNRLMRAAAFEVIDL